MWSSRDGSLLRLPAPAIKVGADRPTCILPGRIVV